MRESYKGRSISVALTMPLAAAAVPMPLAAAGPPSAPWQAAAPPAPPPVLASLQAAPPWQLPWFTPQPLYTATCLPLTLWRHRQAFIQAVGGLPFHLVLSCQTCPLSYPFMGERHPLPLTCLSLFQLKELKCPPPCSLGGRALRRLLQHTLLHLLITLQLHHPPYQPIVFLPLVQPQVMFLSQKDPK